MPEICRSFGVLIEPADKITGVLLREAGMTRFFIFTKNDPCRFFTLS